MKMPKDGPQSHKDRSNSVHVNADFTCKTEVFSGEFNIYVLLEELIRPSFLIFHNPTNFRGLR